MLFLVLEVPSRKPEVCLVLLRTSSLKVHLVHFVDGPKALNCGVKKARVPGVPQSPAGFRWGGAPINITLRFLG